jgi:hypothetical protein
LKAKRGPVRFSSSKSEPDPVIRPQYSEDVRAVAGAVEILKATNSEEAEIYAAKAKP